MEVVHLDGPQALRRSTADRPACKFKALRCCLKLLRFTLALVSLTDGTHHVAGICARARHGDPSAQSVDDPGVVAAEPVHSSELAGPCIHVRPSKDRQCMRSTFCGLSLKEYVTNDEQAMVTKICPVR